jgi:hypothetical protein
VTHYVLVIMYFTLAGQPTGPIEVMDLPPGLDDQMCQSMTAKNDKLAEIARAGGIKDAAKAIQICRVLNGEIKR